MAVREIDNSESHKSSFAANTAFSILGWATPLIFSFVVTPYLIRELGIEQYGYYSLVLAVIAFGFTTGIGKVSAKYIPEYRASGNIDQLSQILSATLLLTVAVAIFEGLILALANPFLVEGPLNVTLAAQAELKASIAIACLIGPIAMLSQLFQSAAQGLHLFRTSTAITVLAALAVNSGSILLALIGFSYFYIFIWNLLVAAVGAIVLGVSVKQYLPELKVKFGLDALALKKVGRFAINIFIYQSIMSVLFIFERAFVLRHFGAEALTFYTVPLMLGVYLHALIVSFSQAAVPKLNEKLGRPEELAAFYRRSTKVVLAVTATVWLGYVVLGREFLSLWLGEGFGSKSFTLLLLHGSAFALIAIAINCWVLAEAAHHSEINAFIASTISVLGVVMIFFLAPGYELHGVAAGRLIGAAVVLPMIPFLEAKIFGTPMTSFWVANIAKLIVAAAGAFFTGMSLGRFLPASWYGFVFTAASLTLTFAAILFLLRYFTVEEVQYAKSAYLQ